MIDHEKEEIILAPMPGVVPPNTRKSEAYPPIDEDVPMLRCHATGQLYPNLPEYRTFSDMLEPYYDEPDHVFYNAHKRGVTAGVKVAKAGQLKMAVTNKGTVVVRPDAGKKGGGKKAKAADVRMDESTEAPVEIATIAHASDDDFTTVE